MSRPCRIEIRVFTVRSPLTDLITCPVFSPDSFWNTPIPAGAPTAADSDRWLRLLHEFQPGNTGLHINLHAWTFPVFRADAGTPRRQLHPKLLRCNLSQGHVKTVEKRLGSRHVLGLHPSVKKGVPVPKGAVPDKEADAHMCVIDTDARRAYDLWQCRQEEDGTWLTNSAIAYDLDGPGVFTREDIADIGDDESVHFYGPCRASGTPILAGLILKQEMESGRIAHKLAFCCPVPGLQRYVSPPAIWTDGWMPEGLPEGSLIQLDPALDLSRFSLSPAARVVTRALQEYGAVLCDYGGSASLYGELLEPHPGKTWRGSLGEEDLFPIRFEHFRVLESDRVQAGGSHPVYHCGMSALFYDYIRRHGTESLEKLEPWRVPFLGHETGSFFR